MKVSIGTTVIAAGAAGGEPSRLASGSGTRVVQVSARIRASDAAIFDRGNRSYVDVVEADYSYATFALAQAAFLSLRSAALEATGSLVYGDGEDAVTIGPGLVRTAEVVEWTGCGLTMRYEIVCVEE
jgi:hypothetical protein